MTHVTFFWKDDIQMITFTLISCVFGFHIYKDVLLLNPQLGRIWIVNVMAEIWKILWSYSVEGWHYCWSCPFASSSYFSLNKRGLPCHYCKTVILLLLLDHIHAFGWTDSTISILSAVNANYFFKFSNCQSHLKWWMAAAISFKSFQLYCIYMYIHQSLK